MKFGICNEIFKEWSWERTVAYVGSVGYKGIEIAPFTLAPSADMISAGERDRIRKTAVSAGIEIIGLHWLLASPEGMSVATGDREILDRTAAYLRSLIRLCADLGGTTMVFGSPRQRNIPALGTFEETYRRIKALFSELLPEAEKAGIVFAFEPLARTETNFINTARQAVRLIRDVAHPNLRLHLDVKAMCDEGLPLPDIIRSSGTYLHHFHANDENLRGPGTGPTDYAPIFKTLSDIGYEGYVSVEVFDFTEGPEAIARNSLTYMKNMYNTTMQSIVFD